MSTALVTGGTGFLGSHVVRVLVEAGHTVRVLHRRSSPLDLIDGLPVEHVIGDVVDSAALERAVQGCDWVFHVAAISEYWRESRIKLYLVNVNGTINVLNAARRAGVRRVIFTSSAYAVGFRFDGIATDESMPFNLPPRQSPYGHSKWLAEEEVRRAVADGLDAVILNPTAIYGPGDLHQISGTEVVQIANGFVPVYPAGAMTVVDVRDVADAHLAAAERGRSGERYLVGGVDITHKDRWKLIAEITGRPAPLFPIPAAITPLVAMGADLLLSTGVKLPVDASMIRLGAYNLFFNCQKAWREFGEPKIGVRQSLEDTYQWYVERGIIKRTLRTLSQPTL